MFASRYSRGKQEDPPSRAALATLGLVACSGGGGDSPAPSSKLSISLMDAPVDGVTAVYVKITSMWIKPQGGGPAVQLPLTSTPLTVNLMELTDTNAAILIDEAVIEPGSYEWLAMDVAAERNVRDSYVMTETGGERIELRVQHRVRLVGGSKCHRTSLSAAVRWDMRQGLVYPPPASIHVEARVPHARRHGVACSRHDRGSDVTVDPAVNNCASDDKVDLKVGNVVYVFEGSVTPDDVDGTGDPLATVEATPNAAGDYVYRTLLEPGTYTVVFSCEAGNDDPEAEDDITFLNPVGSTNPVASQGNTTIVNF
jgi:hypothetical protein